MTFKNGDTYEGEYMNGEHHGRGKYKCAGSCEFYDGQYSDGERHGQGTEMFANGDVYVGGYKNDEMCGKGKMTFASGAVRGQSPCIQIPMRSRNPTKACIEATKCTGSESIRLPPAVLSWERPTAETGSLMKTESGSG